MYIGIDVGGTNLRVGLTDETGAILAIRQEPLEFRDAESFVKTLVRLTRTVLKDAGADETQVASVGIGLPGAVRGGEVLYTANIPMKHVPLAELFRRELDLPVRLENDASCAAYGEWLRGSGRGCDHFAVITLGTGIGGGFVLNRRLFTGVSAGEVGHMVVERNGVLCECGRRGCWEAYASAPGLVRMAREALARCPESILQGKVLNGKTIFDAARQGDETALAVCRTFVEYLALGITNLINIFQPEVLALSGGLADAPEDLLLKPLRKAVEETCYSRHLGLLPRILRAELGNDAGVVGAALLGRPI